MKKYEIEVLTGTTYLATVEAESLDEAIEMAEALNPYELSETEGIEWSEGETDRAFIIAHSHGVSTFGFGVRS